MSFLDSFIPGAVSGGVASGGNPWAAFGGGLLNYWQDKKQREQQSSQRNREDNYAKNSIKWRVQDAREAGISPLVALGISPFHPSASQVGSNLGPIAEMAKQGQDITRAARAGMSKEDKVLHDIRLQQSLAQLDNLKQQGLNSRAVREKMLAEAESTKINNASRLNLMKGNYGLRNELIQQQIKAQIMRQRRENQPIPSVEDVPVSYTHLTLPTICSV